MSPKEWSSLVHIAFACRELVKNVDLAKRDEYLEDSWQLSAMVKNIELIGEDAKHLSEETKAEFPEIPWRRFIRTRDKFAHGYFSLEFDVIWRIATEEVPIALKHLISRYPELKDAMP